MYRMALILSLISCVAGCAITSPRTSAAIAATGETGAPITCATAGDCKTKWDRAQLWIVRHSAWKIQTATDVLIQTFNPVNDPTYGFTVTREPDGHDGYTIEIQVGCGTIFGCGSEPMDVVKAFAYYVRTGNDILPSAGYVGGIH